MCRAVTVLSADDDRGRVLSPPAATATPLLLQPSIDTQIHTHTHNSRAPSLGRPAATATTSAALLYTWLPLPAPLPSIMIITARAGVTDRHSYAGVADDHS